MEAIIGGRVSDVRGHQHGKASRIDDEFLGARTGTGLPVDTARRRC